MTTLLVATAAVAAVHSLAPDHWLPFVAIGRAQGWSRRKLLAVTALAGLGHVGSSVLLGALGILGGLALARLEGVESVRGRVAGILLIGFGVAYAVWGLRRARAHSPSSRIRGASSPCGPSSLSWCWAPASR